jgi:hypothetical protein
VGKKEMSWLEVLLIVMVAGVLIQQHRQGDNFMALTAQQKQQITDALATLSSQLLNALQIEKGELITQIQALKDKISGGGTVTQDDMNFIVNGIGTLGTAIVPKIDALSQEDGADDTTGTGTGDGNGGVDNPPQP